MTIGEHDFVRLRIDGGDLLEISVGETLVVLTSANEEFVANGNGEGLRPAYIERAALLSGDLRFTALGSTHTNAVRKNRDHFSRDPALEKLRVPREQQS